MPWTNSTAELAICPMAASNCFSSRIRAGVIISGTCATGISVIKVSRQSMVNRWTSESSGTTNAETSSPGAWAMNGCTALTVLGEYPNGNQR
jgi:hypothetical protein